MQHQEVKKKKKMIIVYCIYTHNYKALDLLEKLLAFDPMLRIDVETALNHPYFDLFHDPEDEVFDRIEFKKKTNKLIRSLSSLHIHALLISLLNL